MQLIREFNLFANTHFFLTAREPAKRKTCNYRCARTCIKTRIHNNQGRGQFCKKYFLPRQYTYCESIILVKLQYHTFAVFSVVYSDVVQLMAASQICCPNCRAVFNERMRTVPVFGIINIQPPVHSSICCQIRPDPSLNSTFPVGYVTQN